jgi:hypothetical protein
MKERGQRLFRISERIEPDLIGLGNEHFDGRFVIEDHLGFQDVFTLCRLTEFDQVWVSRRL